MTGRLDPLAALAALAVVLFLAVAVDSHSPQPYVPAATFAPFPTPWPDATDTLPPHSSGPVEVAPRPGTPVRATVGQGRWHSIRTTYYGGTDGLDDGSHYFADGGLFLAEIPRALALLVIEATRVGLGYRSIVGY
jgi:hypothetical protein